LICAIGEQSLLAFGPLFSNFLQTSIVDPMNTHLHNIRKIYLPLLTLVLLMPAGTHAQTVYFDSFPGAANANLTGTAPSTRPGLETWTASTVFKADGSYTPPSGTSTDNRAAFLPFNLLDADPDIYRLSVAVNSVANINASIGFTKTNSTSVTAANTFSTFLRLTGIGSDAGNVTAVGTGFTSTNIGTFLYATNYTLNLEVDTRESIWTASFWLGENAKQTFNLGDAVKNEISGVGFHISKGNNSIFDPGTQVLFDNFTLEVVPEPSTVMLVALGGLFLFVFRHKLRARMRP